VLYELEEVPQRYSDLKAKEKILADAKATLETLYKERDSFRAQLREQGDGFSNKLLNGITPGRACHQ
jgi:hypothetical protein